MDVSQDGVVSKARPHLHLMTMGHMRSVSALSLSAEDQSGLGKSQPSKLIAKA